MAGQEGYSKGYGKRPMWQWVLIYLVVGGIVYALIYYFVLGKKGTPYQGPSGSTEQSSPNYGY